MLAPARLLLSSPSAALARRLVAWAIGAVHRLKGPDLSGYYPICAGDIAAAASAGDLAIRGPCPPSHAAADR